MLLSAAVIAFYCKLTYRLASASAPSPSPPIRKQLCQWPARGCTAAGEASDGCITSLSPPQPIIHELKIIR